MKWRTFIVGYAFLLALLLLIQHRPGLAQGEARSLPSFRAIVDLTRAAAPANKPTAHMVSAVSRARPLQARNLGPETRMESPALYSPKLWTVGQIPADRLVAPLVVLDVRNATALELNHQIRLEDIAAWERTHGAVPNNAVIAAETNCQDIDSSHRNPRLECPGFSLEAAKFLIQARMALALATDASVIATGDQKKAVDAFTLAHSVYHVENLTNLDRVPATGSIAMIAPGKLSNAAIAPARVLAVVR